MDEKYFNLIFSNNLNRYLQKYDMTQLELAKRLGVSPASVSHWCNGKKSPRMDKVDKMCDIFHCLRSDLMEDKDDTNKAYYTDPETAKLAQEVFDNPDLRILFDAAKNSRPEDIKMAADMLRRFKETNPDG